MLNTFLVKMPLFWKRSAGEKAITYAAFPMNTINESESHSIFVYDFQEETTTDDVKIKLLLHKSNTCRMLDERSVTSALPAALSRQEILTIRIPPQIRVV
jgi:hypothetical protein